MSAILDTAHMGAWANIPQELVAREQWLLAAPAGHPTLSHKQPCYIDTFGRVVAASIKKVEKLHTFEAVCTHAARLAATGHAFGIGYVLQANDPYVIVDLDDKVDKPASPQDHELFKFLIGKLDSYTEVSQSGRGAHIIVRANCTTNFRRDRVECYSSKRFMIITGNVVRNVPIADRTEFVLEMTERMYVAQGADENIELDDEGREELSDKDVHARASTADNADKYLALLAGDIATYHNGDHSQADAAFMQFLWFHSRNKAQTVRMFMQTPLAQRDKAKQRFQDYVVNRTLRQAMERLERDEAGAATVTFAETFLGITPVIMPVPEEQVSHLQLAVDNVAGIDLSAMLAAQGARAGNPRDEIIMPEEKVDGRMMKLEQPIGVREVPTPPPMGRLKRLVDYIQGSSMFSKPEIALGGALGLISGIAGAAYQTIWQGTGLSQYFIIVAQSGTGKQSMHTAIGNVIAAVSDKGVSIRQHFNFTDYGSPQALFVKGILEHESNSVVHISSEWGQQMAAMSQNANSAAPAIYRKLILEMYDKSKAGAIVQEKSVLTKENAGKERGAFAYTVLSETNPDTFFDCFKEADASDGYLSRLSIIEYTGTRGVRNWNTNQHVPDDVVDDVIALYTQAATINALVSSPSGIPQMRNGNMISGTYTVPWEPDAENELRAYVERIDNIIDAFQKSNSSDMRQHIWMRADVRVLRTATLLAVYENPIKPVVTMNELRWAISMNEHCANTITRREAAGEISGDGVKGYTVLLSTLRNYVNNGYTLQPTEEVFHKIGYISQAAIGRLCGSRFTRYFKQRATQEMNMMVQRLVDEGRLLPVKNPNELMQYGISTVRGKVYKLINLG